MTKRALLVTAALAPLFAFGMPAYGQTEAAADAEGSGIGEIVVTATRRSENLQRAPAAITAVTGEELVARGIVDTTGLTKLVPSSRIDTGPTDGIIQAIIRGIGNDLATPFVYEPVALNMNDAYVPRVASTMPLFDIERIEVLPGPQGTLYGKSAIGGVINVSAKQPGQDLGMDLSASYGNYDAIHLTGALNVPVTDKLAFRVAADYDKRDPFFTNGNGDRDSFATRVSLKYDPIDDISIYVWGEYNRQRNVPAALIYVNPFVNKNPFVQPRFEPRNGVADNFFNRNNRDEYRVGARIDMTVAGVDISYIPTYTDLKADTVAVNITRYVPALHHLRHWTQELRFSGNITQRLSWLGGLYYEDSADFNFVGANLTAPTLPPLFGFEGDFVSTSKGANLQFRYEATDALRFIVGGRYTKDTATPRRAFYYLGARSAFPDRSSKKWDNFDWKVGVEADIGPRSMVYANVQTAYSPGGYQSLGPIAGQRIEEQNMIGYTIGSKNRFLDNTLQLNVEAFYYDYKNYLLSLTAGGLPVSFTVPKSRSYGADISMIYAPTTRTRLNVGVGLLNAEIKTFVSAANVNYAGKKLPASPKATISAGFEQSFDVTSDGQVIFRADTFYNDGFYGEFTNSSFARQKSYTRSNASLTYENTDGGWSVGAFVRNIEKTYNKTLMALTGLPAPYSAVGGVDAPRTYGVQLKWKFGNP